MIGQYPNTASTQGTLAYASESPTLTIVLVFPVYFSNPWRKHVVAIPRDSHGAFINLLDEENSTPMTACKATVFSLFAAT